MVNMRDRYESIALTDLREMAKNRKIKGASSMKKADLVEAMLIKDREDERNEVEAAKEAAAAAKAEAAKDDTKKAGSQKEDPKKDDVKKAYTRKNDVAKAASKPAAESRSTEYLKLCRTVSDS